MEEQKMSAINPQETPLYDRLLALPQNLVGEIINGELHTQPPPAGPHALAIPRCWCRISRVGGARAYRRSQTTNASRFRPTGCARYCRLLRLKRTGWRRCRSTPVTGSLFYGSSILLPEPWKPTSCKRANGSWVGCSRTTTRLGSHRSRPLLWSCPSCGFKTIKKLRCSSANTLIMRKSLIHNLLNDKGPLA